MNSRLKISAVLIALFVGQFATSPVYAGTVCKQSGWIGQAVHALKLKAKKKAIKDWRAKVIAHHGAPWASWSLASYKSLSCFKERSKWRCLASGVPCKKEFGLKL